MLRKMIKGGYRRKPGTEWSFVLSNKDIHDLCGTEEISDFTARQQRKYLAHLVRQPNAMITKILLFNNDHAHKPGRQSTLENRVLQNEKCTADDFYRKARNRLF